VGDQVYHAPDKSLGLSQNIEDYYYAIGSDAALTPELRSRRVGGAGRWHIFHLPEGPSMLQTGSQYTLDRRSSISRLNRLRSGQNLPKEFPEYNLVSTYENPLSESERKVEAEAVKLVTADHVTSFLKKFTDLGTRSYSDESASAKTVDVVEKEFKSLGYQTCLQKFSSGSSHMINVVAYAPGAEQDSVVVGAHYDSCPFKGLAPGAEDNGSGLATLLTMAQALKEAKVATKKSVYLVAFAGEEGGLLGSKAFADALANEGDGIPDECKPSQSFLQVQFRNEKREMATKKKMMGAEAAIIMDEVGWVSPNFKKDGKPRRTVNLETYDWTDSIMQHLAGASKDFNGDDLYVTHSNNPFGSDHISFLHHEMKAVLTINGDDESYPNYHQSSDTIENVTPEYAASIGKMNMGGLLRMTGIQ